MASTFETEFILLLASLIRGNNPTTDDLLRGFRKGRFAHTCVRGKLSSIDSTKKDLVFDKEKKKKKRKEPERENGLCACSFLLHWPLYIIFFFCIPYVYVYIYIIRLPISTFLLDFFSVDVCTYICSKTYI